MFSFLSKRKIIILSTLISLLTNAFNLEQSKITLFSKELKEDTAFLHTPPSLHGSKSPFENTMLVAVSISGNRNFQELPVNNNSSPKIRDIREQRKEKSYM